MSLFSELKRRNVFRVAIAYLAVAWLVLQVADVVLDNIAAPGWVFQAILLVVILGFAFVLVFAWAFELTPAGLKRESEVDRSESMTRTTGRKLDFAIIAVLAAALSYFIWESRFGPGDSEAAISGSELALPTRAAAHTEGPSPASVAVLPFVNMSREQDNEYFSDGLTETLLHMLAQLPDLQVAARTSSFAFKGQNRSVSEIASELGVAHILEGSVQRADGRVRITAQLVRAGDGFHVWSQSYTRPLEDIFAIQDEIAGDVASALGTSLLGRGDETLHGVATSNLSAYESYLRGLEQQAIFSYASLGEAESHFRQALALDPEFTDARVALIRNYLYKRNTGLIREEELLEETGPLLRQVHEQVPGDRRARLFELTLHLYTEAASAGRAAVEATIGEILELLVELPTETHIRNAVSNFISAYLEQPQKAAEVLEAGLLIDPLAVDLLSALSREYVELGRLDDARRVLERALSLAPEYPNSYHRMSAVETAGGNMAQALDWMRKAAAVDPQDHELAAYIALNLFWLDLPEEAERWRARVRALAPSSAVARLVELDRAYTRGDEEGTLEIARSMIEDQVEMRYFAFGVAVIYYADLMLGNGRAQEAHEFFVSLRPDIADFDTVPADRQGAVMQLTAVSLMSGFAPFETRRETWTKLAASRDAHGAPWREDAISALDRYYRGDLEGAVEAYLEFLEPPLATGLYRKETYFRAETPEIYDDPRVVTRLADLDREFQAMRSEVREMLLRPEWNE